MDAEIISFTTALIKMLLIIEMFFPDFDQIPVKVHLIHSFFFLLLFLPISCSKRKQRKINFKKYGYEIAADKKGTASITKVLSYYASKRKLQ